MKIVSLFLSLACLTASLSAAVVAGRYDMPAVRDTSTLETTVIQDWKPWAKDATIRQKFIEITAFGQVFHVYFRKS